MALLPPGESYNEVTDLIGGQDSNDDAGFILAEESALRKYLSGTTVPIYKSGQQTGGRQEVPVYFRWPTSERNIVYPYITIDLLSVDPAYTRWHSWTNPMLTPALYSTEDDTHHAVASRYYPDVARDFEPSDDAFGFWTGPYQPYDLLFQISVFSRTVHHDRFLTSRFFVDFMRQRNFWVSTDIDGVWHRCETMGFVSGDSMETMEATKRQFRKIFTVRMETEIPSTKLYELRKVDRVDIKLFDEQRFLMDEIVIEAPEVTP